MARQPISSCLLDIDALAEAIGPADSCDMAHLSSAYVYRTSRKGNVLYSRLWWSLLPVASADAAAAAAAAASASV